MRITIGDILSVHRGIIVHQVNCQRVMGAGLALKIRRKYYRHYLDYMGRQPQLGEAFFTQMAEDFYIAGIYGQERVGRGETQTDYDTLANGFRTVAHFSYVHHLPVYLPYGIGCGLAGGDWDVVSALIEQYLPNAVVIKLPEK